MATNDVTISSSGISSNQIHKKQKRLESTECGYVSSDNYKHKHWRLRQSTQQRHHGDCCSACKNNTMDVAAELPADCGISHDSSTIETATEHTKASLWRLRQSTQRRHHKDCCRANNHGGCSRAHSDSPWRP